MGHRRYAAWDVTTVHLVDPPTQTVLCRLFPLDRTIAALRRACRIRTATLCATLTDLVAASKALRTQAGYTAVLP